MFFSEQNFPFFSQFGSQLHPYIYSNYPCVSAEDTLHTSQRLGGPKGSSDPENDDTPSPGRHGFWARVRDSEATGTLLSAESRCLPPRPQRGEPIMPLPRKLAKTRLLAGAGFETPDPRCAKRQRTQFNCKILTPMLQLPGSESDGVFEHCLWIAKKTFQKIFKDS